MDAESLPSTFSSDVLQIQGILRKIVHFLMFATVGFVLAQGLQRANQLKIIRRSDASPSLTRLALLVTILLGASDELFQMFVPDRRASLFDVAIDSLGAACGIWIWWTRDHRTIPSPQSRPPHLNESGQRTGKNSEREPHGSLKRGLAAVGPSNLISFLKKPFVRHTSIHRSPEYSLRSSLPQCL